MIVGIHGIRCHRYLTRAGTVELAGQALAAEWTAALGLPLGPGLFHAAYHGRLLHPGTAQGANAPEQLPPGTQCLLTERVSALGAPAEVTMGPGTLPVRRAVGRLAERYGATAQRFAAQVCREVDTYISDPASARRATVRDEVHRVLTERRPKMVIAHSLGSLVVYEALWHRPVEPDLLVTLGSPLGMPPASPRPA
jgi:hypothetical protein